MKAIQLVLGVVMAVALPAVAQTRAELDATCTSLAKLTETALKNNNASAVLVYIQAAGLIRVAVNDATACYAQYFVKVVAENGPVLGSVAAVLTAQGLKPVKGWTHREIDDFFSTVDGLSPAAVIANTKFQRANPTVDITKLAKDFETLKTKESKSVYELKTEPSLPKTDINIKNNPIRP